MLRKILIPTVIGFLLTLESACSPAKPVILGAADNGSRVNVKVGESIIIRLESNPSTGYTWEAKDLDTTIFRLAGDPTFISNDPGVVGSSGVLTLTFITMKAGTASLKLAYQRPWESNVEPIDTFTITVTVK